MDKSLNLFYTLTKMLISANEVAYGINIKSLIFFIQVKKLINFFFPIL